MKNYSIQITHSLSFLSNTLLDIKSIIQDAEDVLNEIYHIHLEDDGAPGTLRKKASKFREYGDDKIELILADYQLFDIEIKELIKHKHDEGVIFSLRKYRDIYENYKDVIKEVDTIYNKMNIKKTRCRSEKQYVKIIAIMKIMVPVYQSKVILDRCKKKIEVLINEKEKKEDA